MTQGVRLSENARCLCKSFLFSPGEIRHFVRYCAKRIIVSAHSFIAYRITGFRAGGADKYFMSAPKLWRCPPHGTNPRYGLPVLLLLLAGIFVCSNAERMRNIIDLYRRIKIRRQYSRVHTRSLIILYAFAENDAYNEIRASELFLKKKNNKTTLLVSRLLSRRIRTVMIE